MECTNCGAEIPEGQSGCPNCRTTSARQETAPAEEINRLHAEANLLRLRGQLDNAISICTRILRMDPNHAATHSLLGDIYEEQGNYREAMGWYKLAVQLNPNNYADRKKLDEMIDLVFRASSQGADSGVPHLSAPDTPAPKPSSGKRNMRAAMLKIRPVHVVLATTLLAIAVTLVITAVYNMRAPAQHVVEDEQPGSTTSAVSVVTNPGTAAASATAEPPRVTAPPPDRVEAGETLRNPDLPGVIVTYPDRNGESGNRAPRSSPPVSSGPVLENSGTPNEVPPFQPEVTMAPMDTAEVTEQTAQLDKALRAKLTQSKLPTTLSRITIDPRTRNATFDFVIPTMPGPSETKKGLLYAGFYLIWAGMDENPGLRSFTLRGYEMPERGNAPLLTLIADVYPAQARAARSAQDYRTVSQYLSEPWWRAEVVSAPL